MRLPLAILSAFSLWISQAHAAPEMPAQQQSFCKTLETYGLRQNAYNDSQAKMNPIQRARASKQPNLGYIWVADEVNVLGPSGGMQDWVGTLIGINASTVTKTVTFQVIFNCKDTQFSLAVHPPLAEDKPSDPKSGRKFGLVPLDSPLATQLSDIPPGSAVVFSGNLGLTHAFKNLGVPNSFIGGIGSPATTGFVANITTIRKAP